MECSEGGGGFGKAESTKGSRSSWDVFWKSAIAGASIAAALCVAPLALICLALSFPFVLLFAGLACTNKAMMHLFPLPRQAPHHEKQSGEETAEEGEGEEEAGGQDGGEEKAGRIEIERDGEKREEPVEGETRGAAAEEEGKREEKEGEGEGEKSHSKAEKGKSKKATSKKSAG